MLRAEDERAAQEAVAWRSYPRWRDRLRARLRPNTSIVIASFVSVFGPRAGGLLHGTEMRVDAHVAGPTLPASIEVVQYADGGLVYSCGGLSAEVTTRYALVVSPSAAPDTYELLLEFPDILGWAAETAPGSGLFQFTRGPDAITLAQLVAVLGDTP